MNANQVKGIGATISNVGKCSLKKPLEKLRLTQSYEEKPCEPT